MCVLLLIAFVRLVDYTADEATDADVQQYYTWYLHVSIMVFIGFGFLMTFLKRYSYSAVGLNFLASALVMLEYVVMSGYMEQVLFKVHDQELTEGRHGALVTNTIKLNLPLMIEALYCAASAMITFGAVLGKCSPTQLIFLVALEVPVYVVNEHLALVELDAVDIGGSITIHVFGAFFGLAAALALCKPGTGQEHPKNRSNHPSDVTAMLGTIMLFIFWPSFNAGLASRPVSDLEGLNPPPQVQFYVVVNTAISLMGACLTAFATSAAIGNKLSMVHIQNATLAGGVAVGASATLKILPAGALGLGMVAGILSVVGYAFITPALERSIGLRDTCGVLSLHAMPGVLAGLAAAIASVTAYDDNVLVMAKGRRQWQYNLAALAATLAISSVAGWIVGKLVDVIDPKRQNLTSEQMFEDSVYWEDNEDHPVKDVVDVPTAVPLMDVSVREACTGRLFASLYDQSAHRNQPKPANARSRALAEGTAHEGSVGQSKCCAGASGRAATLDVTVDRTVRSNYDPSVGRLKKALVELEAMP